jgi:hypothetical protein
MDTALTHVTLNDTGEDVKHVVIRLIEAKTEEDISLLFSNDYAVDMLQSCGVSYHVKLVNKHIVAQSIIEHEALFKISHLDQFMEGLKKVLQLVENFPTEFMDYFVYTNGDILHEDVIEAMYTDDDLSETENNIFNYFCQYIRNLSPKGTCNL